MRSFFQPASVAVVRSAGPLDLRTQQVLRNAKARLEATVAELEYVDRLLRGPGTVPPIAPDNAPELAILCTPPPMLPAAISTSAAPAPEPS